MLRRRKYLIAACPGIVSSSVTYAQKPQRKIARKGSICSRKGSTLLLSDLYGILEYFVRPKEGCLKHEKGPSEGRDCV